ncbi:MAG: branched-chain amino acid aminotransferase [Muribaculaceae bacterium]|nr:branched-chain amino acid aminotransferase [Muribaculaceae bacterium]
MLNWSQLSFSYIPTDYNVRCTFKDGKWGDIEVSDSAYIPMHMAAVCLHYGQEAFEGLKAFRGKDGKIRIFRMDENAKRFVRSAEKMLMAPLPVEKFCEMVKKVVKLNERFIPPYGSGASLYIRPLEIGVSPKVGVSSSDEFLVVIFVTPVGPYFKAGFKPIKVCISRDYDRVPPKGTGSIKVGGNYGASLEAGEKAHEWGYSNLLYLDPQEKKYIDECGAANFYGIKNNTYVTPASESILPSITNMSLQQLVKDMGMNVERRQVPIEELSEFEEAGACGTAAVCSPISQIDDIDTGISYVISKDGEPGPITTKLYNRIRAIQLGEEPDIHNWCVILE